MLAFGDVHFPQQNAQAVEVFCRAAEHIRPDLIVCTGDLLDCGQFSSHPPTYGVPETNYEDDLDAANAMLDRLQATCQRMALVEGNHEHRLDRWAAKTAEGRGAYSLLAPRIQLMRGRKRCTYIPYSQVAGTLPHYKANSRIRVVHGWSYAKNATRMHLDKSQGKTIIHGHTHRGDDCEEQDRWGNGPPPEAHSTRCLCNLVPMYGVGAPTTWVNGFLVGYLGRRSDYIVKATIWDGCCILPDGTEITA
jgi:predicted phosphodiesterase